MSRLTKTIPHLLRALILAGWLTCGSSLVAIAFQFEAGPQSEIERLRWQIERDRREHAKEDLEGERRLTALEVKLAGIEKLMWLSISSAVGLVLERVGKRLYDRRKGDQ